MKTKLTICKYFKHVWKCFVWHRDAHWQIIYRVGVFRLIFNRWDLTNTHDILALTACVQKRMAESRDSQRWYTKQMKELFVWYQEKMKSETRITSGSVSSNIRPPVEVYKTRVGVFQQISRHKEVFKKSCDPFSSSISMFRNIGWNTSFIAGAFWYSSSNNQLYSSFREIHSSKFEKCYDDQYSISFFLLHVLLTSFRDAT